MDKKGDTRENQVQWYVMYLALERNVQEELNLLPWCDQTLNMRSFSSWGSYTPKMYSRVQSCDILEAVNLLKLNCMNTTQRK